MMLCEGTGWWSDALTCALTLDPVLPGLWQSVTSSPNGAVPQEADLTTLLEREKEHSIASVVLFYVKLIHIHTYGVSMRGDRPFTFLLVAARDTQCYLLEEEGVQTPSPVLPALLGCSVHPVHGLRGQSGTAALRHSRQCPNTSTNDIHTWIHHTVYEGTIGT